MPSPNSAGILFKMREYDSEATKSETSESSYIWYLTDRLHILELKLDVESLANRADRKDSIGDSQGARDLRAQLKEAVRAYNKAFDSFNAKYGTPANG